MFSGLTDKNNVDIFNGDIVDTSNYGKGVVTYVQGDGWFVKTSDDIKEWYETWADCQRRLFWNGGEYSTVIGNTYQNPDLIK